MRLCLLLNSWIEASSIIRISPNHVHIDDPDFFNEYVNQVLPLFCSMSVLNALKLPRVFRPRSEFYKPSEYYDTVGVPGSLVTLTDPHRHQIRRNMPNPLFPARSIDGMSSRTTRTVQRALEIVVADTQAGKVIDLEQLFSRVMVSIFWSFSFSELSERCEL